MLTRIVLPQMVRHALPGFTNNWLVLVKSTALVSVIGLTDLMYRAKQAGAATRAAFFYFVVAAAVVYLAITSVSLLALRAVERRHARGVRRAARLAIGMDFETLLQPGTVGLYASGIGVTLELLAIALAGGLVLSIPLAVLRASRSRLLSWPVAAYTFVIRGTPLLVQVYLIYYGVAQLDWVQARWDAIWPWIWFKEPIFCALTAFVLNTTAYTIELVAGAIRETPLGEVEAAQSFGMGRATLMRRIVLPSALRRALPAYGNEAILMLHATAIASVVPGLVDVTGAANSVYATTYLPFEAYIAAALIYLVLTFALVLGLRALERRALAHLRPPDAPLRATALVPAAPDEARVA